MIVEPMDAGKLPSEAIGLLTQPVEPARWLAYVRERHQFATVLDPVEHRVARCNPGDRYEISRLLRALAGGEAEGG